MNTVVVALAFVGVSIVRAPRCTAFDEQLPDAAIDKQR